MSNLFYPTPFEFVRIMTRHLPKHYTRVLEPAVGEGALLSAIPMGVIKSKELTLVDIDSKRLQSLKPLYSSANLVLDDFLDWANGQPSGSYDLVLANPPFSSRAERKIVYKGKRVGIEYAFIEESIRLLKEGGTLMSIVPSSLVSADQSEPGRRLLIENNEARFVYELPARSFAATEGAFYLIVVVKGRRTKSIRLRKSAEIAMEISVPLNHLIDNNCRADYGFYDALRTNWIIKDYLISLKVASYNIVSAQRCGVRASYNENGVVHTNSFKDGFWNGFDSKSEIGGLALIVKRVARNAHLSFGLIAVDLLPKCSDCIVRIDAHGLDVLRALFFLRVVYSNNHGASCLLRGCGAKYISVRQVRTIIIYDISEVFEAQFQLFSERYFERDFEACTSIERDVYLRLKSKNIAQSIFRRSEADCDNEVAFRPNHISLQQ